MRSTAAVHSWRLLRFAAGLPAFLRHPPLSLAEALARSRAALAAREQSFLDLVRRAIYERRCGPYWRLLDRAGCAFADLEGAVRRRGLEDTLRQLHSEGVRLSFEEFKGVDPSSAEGSGSTLPAMRSTIPSFAADIARAPAAARASRSRPG